MNTEQPQNNSQLQSSDYSADSLNNFDSNDKSLHCEERNSIKKKPSLPFLPNTNAKQAEELELELPFSSNNNLSKQIKSNNLAASEL